MRSEQAQVDNLFYENCQFRQQLKGLKAQLADAETKVQQLQTRLSEREDSEFETDYSTDSGTWLQSFLFNYIYDLLYFL